MKHLIKVAGLCLVAMFAVSMVAAATASAVCSKMGTMFGRTGRKSTYQIHGTPMHCVQNELRRKMAVE